MSLLGLPEAQWDRLKESHVGKFKALNTGKAVPVRDDGYTDGAISLPVSSNPSLKIQRLHTIRAELHLNCFIQHFGRSGWILR